MVSLLIIFHNNSLNFHAQLKAFAKVPIHIFSHPRTIFLKFLSKFKNNFHQKTKSQNPSAIFFHIPKDLFFLKLLSKFTNNLYQKKYFSQNLKTTFVKNKTLKPNVIFFFSNPNKNNLLFETSLKIQKQSS